MTADCDARASPVCRCSVSDSRLPPSGWLNHRAFDKHEREPTRYLFLLGFPYSGTSAVHFLLATSGNVSTIASNPEVLGPSKEGLEQIGLKTPDRWNASVPWPWSTIRTEYHRQWNLSKPLLLENSPPEIFKARELNETFSPGGRVRFLLLVRGACTKNLAPASEGNTLLGATVRNAWSSMARTWTSIVQHFGYDDVFVLRYEDLCLRWPHTFRQLTAWEPLLADVDIDRVPLSPAAAKRHSADSTRVRALPRQLSSAGSHVTKSIRAYCGSARHGWQNASMRAPCVPISCATDRSNSKALPIYERRTGDDDDASLCELSKFFGYAEVDTCV